jgi:hypothetical protein
MLFEIGADSFSPQGVRSVGPRLFENLTLQFFPERRLRLLGHPFPPVMAQHGRRRSQSKTARSLSCAQNPAIGFEFSNFPMALAWGPLTAGWVCFYRTVGNGKIGFVAQRGNPVIGFVFSNLPNGPRLGPSYRRLGLFLQAVGVPQDWVRCAARQASHWVRIFKLPNGPRLGPRTGGWVCFYKTVGDRKIGFVA